MSREVTRPLVPNPNDFALRSVVGAHRPQLDPDGITTGCSCRWKTNPFRSDLKTSDQFIVHVADFIAEAWVSQEETR